MSELFGEQNSELNLPAVLLVMSLLPADRLSEHRLITAVHLNEDSRHTLITDSSVTAYYRVVETF